MDVIGKNLSTILRVFITNLPCHIVTLQGAVCVRQAIIKYKNGANIKEVVRLYVFLFLPLLLTITIHLHHGRWWPILYPPY